MISTEEIYEKIGMSEQDILQFLEQYTFGSNTLNDNVGIARFSAALALKVLTEKMLSNMMSITPR